MREESQRTPLTPTLSPQAGRGRTKQRITEKIPSPRLRGEG